MAVIKGYIESAGLSRIWQYTQDYPCGTISAFRPDYTRKENKYRSSVLGGLLRNKGFSTILVMGHFKYPDGKIDKENSYFVWDTRGNGKALFKALLDLGEKFEQNSITFAEAGEDFKLYATNPDETGLPVGKPIATFKGTAFGDTKGSPSYSEIRGRPFLWDNYEEVSYGKVEAMDFTKLKASLSVASATQRHHSIEALANKISKGADIVKLVDGIKEQKGTLLARFIINDCGL